MAQHITVVEYDPHWKEAYEKEAALLQNILGKNCTAIYHIGSTARQYSRTQPGGQTHYRHHARRRRLICRRPEKGGFRENRI